MQGSFTHNGLSISQPPAIIDCLRTLKKHINPGTIIEIGTAQGGLTVLLKDTWPKAHVLTWDVKSCPNSKELSWRWISQYTEDVFKAAGFVKTLIERKEQVLVLCDGGNKVKEFNVFAPYLKPGDIIMAHDYANDLCPGWTWSETKLEDVAATVGSLKLEPFLQEIMGQAAWLSYRRPIAIH